MSTAEATASLSKLDQGLNQMMLAGDILGGLDRFYADDATFQEGNGELTRGKQVHRKKLEKFFDSLEKFNGATLHSAAVGENVTMTEWTFDMDQKDGTHILWNEVLVRTWRDGKIVGERYYTAA